MCAREVVFDGDVCMFATEVRFGGGILCGIAWLRSSSHLTTELSVQAERRSRRV